MIHPSQQGPNPVGHRSGLRIVVDRGGRMSSFIIKPWLYMSVVGIFILFGLGYLASTGYLLYRDGMMAEAELRQKEIENSYQNRLALLRAEMDRLSSRQIVESQGIKSQVSTLLDQQEMIDRRQLILDTLIAKARTEGISVAAVTAPLPIPRPVLVSDTTGPQPALQITTSPIVATTNRLSYSPAAESEAVTMTGAVIVDPADGTDPVAADEEEIPSILEELRSTLDDAYLSQDQALRALAAAATNEADRMQSVLAGLNVPSPKAPKPRKLESLDELEASGLGGPFIPAPGTPFMEESLTVEQALSHLRLIRKAGREIPVGSPLPGARTSSGFGYRRDPFMKRRAFHSGIDFKASHGTPVRATAPGKVVFAGRKGGYGKMVEIRHAHGLITRYAHLSSINVRRGSKIDAGQTLGRVGSTGRSTGAHLHYETRNGKTPLNPRRFLAAAGAF